MDPWEEKVVTWLDEQEKVAKAPPKQGVHPAPPVNISVITMSQVFGVLEVPVKNQGKVDERRVGAILRRLGFRRTEKGGHRAWVQTVSLTSSQQPPQAPPIQQPLVVPGQAKPQETDSPTAPPLPPLVLDSQPGGAVAEPASTGTTVGETSSNLEVVSVER